jgi:predicted metal-binding protein
MSVRDAAPGPAHPLAPAIGGAPVSDPVAGPVAGPIADVGVDRAAAAAGPAVRLLVCTSCRAAGEPLEPRADRAGARLAAALAAAVEARVADSPAGDVRARDAHAAVEVVPVECMSVCKRPVTVGLAGAGRWTYVYGDVGPEAVADVLAWAAAYAAAPDGVIPWKTRPEHLKRNAVARLPPVVSAPATRSSASLSLAPVLPPVLPPASLVAVPAAADPAL